ncbi:MAG: hypothetical protein ACK4IX_11200 [Candidatus Sericytochromatia bacterium]
MSKTFKLQKKDDFIEYLKELIILVHKFILKQKKYLDDLKNKIESYESINSIKISTLEYDEISDKMMHIQGYLLNLIGDQSKDAMSYKKFRQKISGNKHIFGLKTLNNNISSILNQFNTSRNWSMHVPESLLNSRIKINKDLNIKPLLNPINIAEYEYYQGRWLVSLYNECKNFCNGFEIVFKQMLEDYSILINDKVEIELIKYPLRELEDAIISINSSKIQKGT